MLTIQCRSDSIRMLTVDDLKGSQQPRIVQQVRHNALEWKGFEVTLLKLMTAYLADELGVRVVLRVAVVQAINILY
jgi:hypothetical protein